MTDSCLFCKIVAGDIKAKVVYQDDSVLAFHDIDPKAPLHVLVIPKRHIATLNDPRPGDAELMGRLILTAQHIAREQGIADAGYRTVINCNRDGGQAVYHIHLHLLGGRQMQWPPG